MTAEPQLHQLLPPGRRRRMLLHLVQHPEYDQLETLGRLTFRLFIGNQQPRVSELFVAEEQEIIEP